MDLEKVRQLMDEIEFTARCYAESTSCEIISLSDEEKEKEARAIYVELKVLLGRLATATKMNIALNEMLEMVNESR